MSFRLSTLWLPAPLGMDSSVGKPGDAIFQAGDIEIQQKPDLFPAQLQIGNQLGFMERNHFLHGFQFDDDCVFNEDVDAVTNVEFHLVVNHRQTYLAESFKPAFSKLINQAGFISRFQKPRPEARMNLNGRSNDFRSECVVGFGGVHRVTGSTTEPKPRNTEILQ